MWTSGVVVVHVLLDHSVQQIPLPEDQHVVYALAAYTAHKPLAYSVGPGRSVRRAQHFYAAEFRHTVEPLAVLAVVVPDQEPARFPDWRCLPQLLGCPFVCWRSGNADVHNPTRADFDYEEEEK